MRIRVTSLFVIAALVLSAGGALAAITYKTGRYRGSTAQHMPITFTVGKRSVSALRFPVLLNCSDGSQGVVMNEGFPRMRIRSGSWRGEFTDGTGAETVTISGRVRKSTSRGRLQVGLKLNGNYQPDPNGSITCDSGSQAFTARHS